MALDPSPWKFYHAQGNIATNLMNLDIGHKEKGEKDLQCHIR